MPLGRINLETIFRNILLGDNKTINVVNSFLYFPLKWCQNFPIMVY